MHPGQGGLVRSPSAPTMPLRAGSSIYNADADGVPLLISMDSLSNLYVQIRSESNSQSKEMNNIVIDQEEDISRLETIFSTDFIKI